MARRLTMRTALAVAAALFTVAPAFIVAPALAHDDSALLLNVARAMGARTLKSIEYSGGGTSFAVGQSPAPGQPWPRFNVKTFTRIVNYETGSLREEVVRTQALDPPRGGGLQPIRGELRQIGLVSGDRAWN